MIIFAFLAFLLYLTVRLLTVRFINSDPQDKWSHLCDAKLLRAKGISESHPMFLPSMPFTYPWGCAWLLNRLGKNPITKFIFTNNVANCLFAVVILIWLYYSTSFLAALIFFMLTVIHPSIASPWNGLGGINARNFGSILSTSIFVVIFELSANLFISLPLQIIIILLSIFFSKFAVQTIFIVSLISIVTVPLAYSNEINILISFLANLCFLIISLFGLLGNSVSLILRGSISHSKFYSEFLQKKSVMLVEKNFSLLHLLRKIARFEIKSVAKNIIFYPYLRLFIFNPIIIAVYFILTKQETHNLTLIYIPYLTTLCLFLAILISFEKLKYLGEGDRYYDFTVGMMASAFVSVNIDIQKPIDLLLISILFLTQTTLFLNLLWKRRGLTKSTNEEYDLEVKDWLDCHAVGETILGWPTTLGDKFVWMTDEDIKFLGLHTNADNSSNYIDDIKNLYSKSYPYPTLKENDLKATYSLRFCVVDKRFKLSATTDGEFRELLKDYLAEYELVFENKQYFILELR